MTLPVTDHMPFVPLGIAALVIAVLLPWVIAKIPNRPTPAKVGIYLASVAMMGLGITLIVTSFNGDRRHGEAQIQQIGTHYGINDLHVDDASMPLCSNTTPDNAVTELNAHWHGINERGNLEILREERTCRVTLRNADGAVINLKD